jgi:Gas vesicle synthesis protein GvpO
MAQSSSNSRPSARELTLAAKETVRDLTGFPPESVTGLQKDGDNWLVTVDVCELERIPNTTDVMATYMVELDEDGELVGYRRSRRFQRGQANEEG